MAITTKTFESVAAAKVLQRREEARMLVQVKKNVLDWFRRENEIPSGSYGSAEIDEDFFWDTSYDEVPVKVMVMVSNFCRVTTYSYSLPRSVLLGE